MGKSKEFFMQMEDFEREGQKDQLYLLEQLAQIAEEQPGPQPGEAKIITKPSKERLNEGPSELDYSLPF